jgi:N-acetylglucosamine kinase-like BadF-type ATPase
VAQVHVKHFLGVDGGGTKSAFLLINDTGQIMGAHAEGPAYYLEVGWDMLKARLAHGIRAVCQQAGLSLSDVDYAFLGLPAYGEDSSLLTAFDGLVASALPRACFRCGNDAVCGWAGALAGQDGINLVCGTGSMAYGVYGGQTARAGGWGELFGDEGSAHWVSREGLTLFARMADGRTERTALYERMRQHFRLHTDLDLCGAVYGKGGAQRSAVAGLAALIARVALEGDPHAQNIFSRAVAQLTELVHAVRARLQIPGEEVVNVSYSGGLFQQVGLLLKPLQTQLSADTRRYNVVAPQLPPVAGAALYAASLSGHPLGLEARRELQARCRL